MYSKIFNKVAKPIGALAIAFGIAMIAKDPANPIGWGGVASGGALLQMSKKESKEAKAPKPSPKV